METDDFKSHFNYKYLVERYGLISNTNLVLFIGAGLSLPLFPSWGAFINKLISSTKQTNRLSEEEVIALESRIEQGKEYLSVAQKCIKIIGEQTYRSLLVDNFDIDFTQEQIPDNYKWAFRLPANLILTTNYDRIPDVYNNGAYRIFSRHNASEALSSYNHGRKVVLKIHGDISHQDSIVLKSDDFRDAIYNDKPVNQLLSNIFQTKTVLFLGFSLTDPHVNLILDFIKSTHKDLLQHHYAFMPNVDPFDVERFEDEYGIRVIPFKPSDYKEISEFIASLVEPTEKKLDYQSEEIIVDELLLHEKIINILNDLAALSMYSFNIDHESRFLDVFFATRAETGIEFQKEILFILENLDIKSSIFDSISLNTFFPSRETNVEHTKFDSIKFKINVFCENIFKYKKSEIDKKKLWESLVIFQYESVGTSNFKGGEVRIPYVNY